MKEKNFCISLVGMPGSGKSTIGARLAQSINWAFMDSDYLLESLYASRLQDITDALGKEAFLDLECGMILSIRASRCVIATGGSVVYRPRAVEYLQSLGPVIHMRVPLESIRERIERNPQRGIAMHPGQTLADLYEERHALYEKSASMACDLGKKDPDECVALIRKILRRECWRV